MASAATAPGQLGLLSLPSEVRVNVLRHLLVKCWNIDSKFTSTQADRSSDVLAAGGIGTRRSDPLKRSPRIYTASLYPEILSTCTTLRHEGIPLLWCENRFIIQKAGDINLIKALLPKRAEDKYLIRHLCFLECPYFDTVRVKELMSFRMLQTIELIQRPIVRRYFSLTPALVASGFGIKLCDMNCEAFKNLLSRRPEVKCHLTQRIEIYIDVSSACDVLGS